MFMKFMMFQLKLNDLIRNLKYKNAFGIKDAHIMIKWSTRVSFSSVQAYATKYQDQMPYIFCCCCIPYYACIELAVFK